MLPARSDPLSMRVPGRTPWFCGLRKGTKTEKGSHCWGEFDEEHINLE